MPTAALSSSAEGAFLSSLSPLSPRGMTDLGCFPSLLLPPTGCYGGAKLSLFCREDSIFVGDVGPLWALALCINCIDRLFRVCLCELLLQPGLILPGLHVCQSACTAFPFGNDRPFLPLSLLCCFHVSFAPRHGAVSTRSASTPTPSRQPCLGNAREKLNLGPSPQESLCQPHHILEEEGAPGRGLPQIAAVLHALLEQS